RASSIVASSPSRPTVIGLDGVATSGWYDWHILQGTGDVPATTSSTDCDPPTMPPALVTQKAPWSGGLASHRPLLSRARGRWTRPLPRVHRDRCLSRRSVGARGRVSLCPRSPCSCLFRRRRDRRPL